MRGEEIEFTTEAARVLVALHDTGTHHRAVVSVSPMVFVWTKPTDGQQNRGS
jgi:hypothetical protein